MKAKIVMLVMLTAFFVSCSTSKDQGQQGYAPDPVYDNLQTGMTKQAVIAVLGNKYDTKTVSQTATTYIERLSWNSANPNVAYVLFFTNNILDRKTREQVVKNNTGGNIHLPR